MRWLILLTVLLNCVVSAQTDLGWALPTHGHPRILYLAADSASDAVAQVTSDDVLLIRCDGTNWCWAQDQHGHQGYVRNDQTMLLTALDDSSATAWMQAVFERERYLGERFNALYLVDPVAQRAYSDSLNQNDMILVAALSLFETHYCRTADDGVLRDLMRAVAANPGSANEEPPTKLAQALQCQAVPFKKVLTTLEPYEKENVLAATTTGLWLSFDERDPTAAAERNRLMELLDEE